MLSLHFQRSGLLLPIINESDVKKFSHPVSEDELTALTAFISWSMCGHNNTHF
ncbi:hypothetical protein [Halpernia sp. GG3]